MHSGDFVLDRPAQDAVSKEERLKRIFNNIMAQPAAHDVESAFAVVQRAFDAVEEPLLKERKIVAMMGPLSLTKSYPVSDSGGRIQFQYYPMHMLLLATNGAIEIRDRNLIFKNWFSYEGRKSAAIQKNLRVERRKGGADGRDVWGNAIS